MEQQMEQMEQQQAQKGFIPFYPHHFTAELALALGFIGLVFFLAGIAPRELRPPANPIMTPAQIKPEWYFLWIYGLLKLVPRLLGLVISALVFLALFLLPWLDRSPHRRPEERPGIIIATLLVLIGLVILTYVGLR